MKTDILLHGDCLELMKEIPDASIDAIICDLPYGTTRNQWDSIIPLPELWAEYKRIAKPNAAIVLFAQTPFDKILGASNLEMLKYEWIWQKNRPTGFFNAKKMPLKIHENILVFYQQPPTYNPQGLVYRPKVQRRGSIGSNYGKSNTSNYSEYENYPNDVLQYDSDTDTFHPTQKPVALLRYLIRTYTKLGGVILDNCAGSGSTLIAAIREKRHYIGMELNEQYYRDACAWIARETSQPEIDFGND